MHYPTLDYVEPIQRREELVAISPSTSKVGVKRSEMLQEAEWIEEANHSPSLLPYPSSSLGTKIIAHLLHRMG